MTFAHFLLTSLLLMAFSVPAADGGVSLNQTRVIFSSGDKAQTLTVKNTGAKKYLIQSRVQREQQRASAAPFIVTPPLFQLGPESSQTLRILKQEQALPTDRESLFYLAVSAIPAQSQPTAQESRLSMGFQFVIKLFYRPAGLKIAAESASCQLRITPTAQGMRIENPTPYFVTFGRLSFDQRAVDLNVQPAMIAPLSSEIYPVSKPVKQVHWQVIDDFGALSAACQ
ncbi:MULTISPECIES: molecular chaperone [unclassified Serratia (in: enterobacteria)]|uniref:fimbrial biogenesis chaperone n=1 Tax=unclassified Serratia (in: enterobacteria) TaxID=2647522 RepID=UPI000505DB3E|nr:MULTISPECIES: molecular chaperone [unclassified Serratia (in: enterobacteria)]KFK96376.1 pilus assembly protein PapD [Serratia sp. Ag2]KFK99851.1 pilus assembly protein PapD [Serratia sp. Ag1]